MADGESPVSGRRHRILLWVGIVALVIAAAAATVWATWVNQCAASHDDCGVVEQLGPKWNKMQQLVAALESGAGETKDLLAVADAESAVANDIRAAQVSVSTPDSKTQLGNWAEGTALTAKGQRAAATPSANSPSSSPAPGVDNDSMRATTLVYNATTALKKACPHLQLTHASQR
jgi:hypothetical protein